MFVRNIQGWGDNGAWNDEWISKFGCRSTDNWQKPRKCAGKSNCALETAYSCSVETTVSDSTWSLSGNGIPDHNACNKIEEQSHSATFPRTPVKRTGDQDRVSRLLVGVINNSRILMNKQKVGKLDQKIWVKKSG